MPRNDRPWTARPQRAPRSEFLLVLFLLFAGQATGGLIPTRAFAQNPLLEALESSAAPATPATEPDSQDPVQAIDQALGEARQRLASLQRAQRTESAAIQTASSSALELTERLIRVLEQRREAHIQANDLNAGREAIESGLARDPSELFGTPPPFPVPILDGVREAYRQAADREAQHRKVVEDRRANLRLALDAQEDLEKDRRRLRDLAARTRAAVERVRLEAELRGVEDRLEIAREQVALSEQLVQNATLEHEIKEIATGQVRAALAWVETHLLPRETDLADAIERLDRERFELDRDLDIARSRLASAEATLRATEERASRTTLEDQADFEIELETRGKQLAHRQRIVALLNDRIEHLERMRTTWRQRYAVLSDELDLDVAPEWRETSEMELARFTRLRRIQETGLAQLRLEIAGLLRRAATANPSAQNAQRWIALEIEDLETLATVYEEDLATLKEAIALEEQLRAELVDRLKERDLGERLRGMLSEARGFWNFELTTSGESPVTPGKIAIALLVFLLGFLVARITTRQLARRLFPRFGFDAGASNAFGALTRYALLATAFLVALRVVNIPLTGFAVAGGAIALGIGFGSQAIVSNFISGLLLLAERPIRMGDLVEINGVVGTVEAIGLRSTRIRTADNFHIIVPNAAFLESNVINWTHQDPNMRMRIVVGVAYGSPVRQVEALLIQAATDHPRSLGTPAPKAYFRDFGDSALVFDVRFWIRYDERTDRPGIESEIRFRIEELFEQNGIVIAFPQLDVHFDASAGTSGGAEEISDSRAIRDSTTRNASTDPLPD